MLKQFFSLLAFLFVSISAQADKIVLLDSGAASLQARADHIQNAQETIRAQYFTIEDDNITSTALALLMDSANRGVKVRLIVDSMHNFMSRKTMSAILLQLHPDKVSNIEIREYNRFSLFRPTRYTRRMHDKGLIIDGKFMISGGRNIANGYFGEAAIGPDGEPHPVFEDSDALIFESPAINTAATYFDNLWNSKFVKPVYLFDYDYRNLNKSACNREKNYWSCEFARRERAEAVEKEETRLSNLVAAYKQNKLSIRYDITDWSAQASTVPAIDFLYDEVVGQKSNLHKMPNNSGERLYEAISKATESVVILTPYLVVTPEQEALFKKLRENNVAVTLVTNSKGSNNVEFAQVGYERTKQIALDSGVEIYEYQGPDTLHAKMVMIDGKQLFIGSFNWDFRSQNLNREVGLLVQLPEDDENSLSDKVVEKFARILRKSCSAGGKICSHYGNQNLEKLSEEEIADLTKAFNLRASKANKLRHMMFPFVKGQL